MGANTDKRNTIVDVIKGVLIVFVLFTHYAWMERQRNYFFFPYIIDMAVPVFLLLSGYLGALSFKRRKVETLSEAYTCKNIGHKVIRYTIPFLIVVIWQIVDPNVIIDQKGFFNKLRWVLNGTIGQGSYFYPVLIQLVFVFPVLYFLIKRKGRRGLLVCLIINAIFEILKWSYLMNLECYRLLVFRYVFVIAAGIYASEYDMSVLQSIVMTVIGGVFIGLTRYEIYTPRIITFWTGTSFIAVMWIVPITIWIIRKIRFRFPPLEGFGKASYNIFLVQMVYYRSYRVKLIPRIKPWKLELLVGMLICLVVGYVFYRIESVITKNIEKILLKSARQ